ncbi:MAG: hypothetical protein RL676_104 [Pseudomonadota bacterium]
MALYESEITQFLRQLKEQKPHLEESQQEGRALLWDKAPIDLNEVERAQAIKVRQKPYVYQTN